MLLQVHLFFLMHNNIETTNQQTAIDDQENTANSE